MGNILSSVENGIMFVERKFYLKKHYLAKDLLSMIAQHQEVNRAYELLEDYYKGRHDIRFRTVSDKNKPNNKLVHNFPKLITDTTTSYFMGKPVTYVTESKKLGKEIEEISHINHEDDVNSEICSMVTKFGHAFELCRIDLEGNFRYNAISPKNMILCRGFDLDETPICAIYYDTKKTMRVSEEVEEMYVTVYTKDSIDEYIYRNHIVEAKEHLIYLQSTPHYFGRVPVIEYLNNEERMGAYETVMTLIDAYNLANSDSVNDINYLNDAYLKIIGLEAEPEAIAEMKENRVIVIDNPPDTKADVNWLVKDINDTHIENIKKRIVDDIHKFSMTPNISDEKFASNLSGVAISYKLHSLECRVAVMERKFNRALDQRVDMMCKYLNFKGNNFKCKDVKIVFTRNIPQNLQEIVSTVATLSDLIPYEDLVAQLPFIHDDPANLKKKLLDQKQEEADIAIPLFDVPNNKMDKEGNVVDDKAKSKEKEPDSKGN